MAKCSGCSGDRCSCVIRAGANIAVSGVGTVQNPYVISGEGGGGAEGGSVPSGSLVMYGGPSAPAGWLLANGAAVSRSAYAALFGAIGTTYGLGDGSTTFNLPNFNGRFPIGADAGHPRGATGGGLSVTLSTAQMPVHSHSMAHTHTINHSHPQGSTWSQNRNHSHTGTTAITGAHSHTGSTNETGYHTHAFYLPSNDSSIRVQTNSSGPQTFPFNFENNIPTTGAGTHAHTIGTSLEGNHAHTFNTGTENANHEHTFDTPWHVGSSGGSSAANTGNSGSGAAVDITPPWVGVQFIIKT